MILKGLQKTTLLDFPTKVACTVFTGGCNFRCPFCHNASLVIGPSRSDDISEDDFFEYISRRKGILDGVCITGGEPLLQPDIIDFCKRIRNVGLLIKLDTNGSYPNKLKEIIDLGLVDYIAMDIKNSRALYAKTCGLDESPSGVEESVKIIMSSGIPYEFRTTVVRELHTKESIASLCEWISGAQKYYLQCFTDSGDLIGEGFSAYSEEEMLELLEIAKKYIPQAQLRGI